MSQAMIRRLFHRAEGCQAFALDSLLVEPLTRNEQVSGSSPLVDALIFPAGKPDTERRSEPPRTPRSRGATGCLPFVTPASPAGLRGPESLLQQGANEERYGRRGAAGEQRPQARAER